jgi:hypothetical protein
MVKLSRDLETRPLLRAAVRAGEVRIRAAQTVAPVAKGEAEGYWVERARRETVRALAKAVALEPEEEWVRFRVWLTPEERAVVDEALELAGKLMPGSSRHQRLEAIAQEYLGEHPLEAGDDLPLAMGWSFGTDRRSREERLRARLEEETERWSYLPEPCVVPAPDVRFDGLRPAEIDALLRELAAKRKAWDGQLGAAARAVKRTGMARLTGFASFEHYCEERLGLSARTVEQRAALEERLWAVPALRRARDQGVSYERLRILARLPPGEIATWVPRAKALTCVALREAVDAREEAPFDFAPPAEALRSG